MSKLIPIACLAMLGTAGYAFAACSETGLDTPQAKAASVDNKAAQGDTVQQVSVSGTRAGDTEMRRLSHALQLRLSANKLDPRVVDSARSADTGVPTQSAATRSDTTPGVRYEMKI